MSEVFLLNKWVSGVIHAPGCRTIQTMGGRPTELSRKEASARRGRRCKVCAPDLPPPPAARRS